MTTAASSLLKVDQELDQLPKKLLWDVLMLYQWKGFWYNTKSMKGMLAFQTEYEALSDDVFLASFPKTGTTWLKALCTYIMQQGDKRKSTDQDELLVRNPHGCVRTLEYNVSENSLPPDLLRITSPRLFRTHLPYNALPDSLKKSECKIVYIARNPKDTLLSMWHFLNKIFVQPNQEPYPLEKAYDAFCKGAVGHGPYFDHVLEYWSESMKMPERILFLKYEDLKRDPNGEVKKLASFLGRPFVNQDEVDEVVWKSSLERLKHLEVNKSGTCTPYIDVPNSSFFRLGNVGDSGNHLTPEMKQHLDEITSSKFEGSGLHFETS